MPDTSQALYRKVVELERQVGWLRRKAKASGWQLDAFLDRHRFGGGKLRWTFSAHSTQIGGSATGGAVWTENEISDRDYACTTYGGPYVTFQGYFSSADAAWQETGDEEFLIWGWCYLFDLAYDGVTIAKYPAAGDNRSWYLQYDTGASNFVFLCNATGLVGGNTTVTSTYTTVAVDTWYFVAAYFEPGTLMRIYVGEYNDIALITDDLAVGVPASLYDGTAPLTIGAIV